MRAAEKQRVVVDVDGVGKVLLQEFANDVYAVSNSARTWGCRCRERRRCCRRR